MEFIDNRNNKSEVDFKDLKAGDVFQLLVVRGSHIYYKIFGEFGAEGYNAIDFTSKTPTRFARDDKVIPVKASLVIEDWRNN